MIPENLDRLPDTMLITDKIVASMASVSRATVWNWASSGLIPKPRRLGPRCSRWELGEIRRALGVGQNA